MKTTLRVRTPLDVIAAVPIVLGFAVEESLVLLTQGATRPFHARLSLPPSTAVPEDFCEALRAPCERNRVRGVVLVALTTRHEVGEAAALAVADALECDGVEVVTMLLADGERWFPVGLPEGLGVGHPYDLADHPFFAEAVYQGRVIHSSRDALAATLDPDPERVAAVQAALADGVGAVAPEAFADVSTATTSADRVVGADGTDGTDGAARVAGVLLAVQDHGVRDGQLLAMTRTGAGRHLDYWREVTRCAPPALRAAPAALAGFAAWLDGDGALAWAAVEMAEAAEPGYLLAGLLGEILDAAMDPAVWDERECGHIPRSA